MRNDCDHCYGGNQEGLVIRPDWLVHTVQVVKSRGRRGSRTGGQLPVLDPLYITGSKSLHELYLLSGAQLRGMLSNTEALLRRHAE